MLIRKSLHEKTPWAIISVTHRNRTRCAKLIHENENEKKLLRFQQL